MSGLKFGSSLIKISSVGALALMTATGFGARAAIPAGDGTGGSDATVVDTDGKTQLACAWYQRRWCTRTSTAVAGVRG